MRVFILSLLLIFLMLGTYEWHDVSMAIEYYGSKLIPSNTFLGKIAFLVIFIFIIFTYEILRLIKWEWKMKTFK